MSRQGASQRSLEEYMSGYDTQVAHNIHPKECKYHGKDFAFPTRVTPSFLVMRVQLLQICPTPPRHLLSTLGSAVLFLLGSASHQGCLFLYSLNTKPPPSNVMVKYVPEVSSWQLLFVRCSMQVRRFPSMG